MKLQNYINHIALVVDASSSMQPISKDLIKVFDNQIEYLKARSKELNQETRVSVYTFADSVENLVFDMDCLRMPSLAQFYRPHGWTALVDGAFTAINDMKKIPQFYGDSSFLVYVFTDGFENRSKYKEQHLRPLISGLDDNWTVAIFVPNAVGIHECKKFGFPQNNIAVWDASSKQGVNEMGNKVQQVTENFMAQRAAGVRGTKNLFELKTTGITSDKVRRELDALDPNDYLLLTVHKDSVIKPFVESWTQKPYTAGSVYFQLTKPEKIQSYKQIALQNQVSGKVYAGAEARKMLGLPDHEVKVSATQLKGFDIFVQSTSNNRKLIGGTKCLVVTK